MNTWTPQQARTITDPQEIEVAPRRPDGTLRRPTTIWAVSDGGDVFVRSTNGRDAAWFRSAIASGSGQILARGTAVEVTFTEADDYDLPRIGAAYRAKYGHYPSIVDHLEEDGPRAATLQVHPA
jgi:hypothetical protein